MEISAITCAPKMQFFGFMIRPTDWEDVLIKNVQICSDDTNKTPILELKYPEIGLR